MNIYTGFLLLSGIICLSLAVIVFQFNKKERINKLFMFTFFFAAYWAFTDFLMRESINLSDAYFWNKASFLWPFVATLLFHFILVFTKNKLLKYKTILVMIYSPAIFLSILDLTTGLISGPMISDYWGFTYSVPSSPFFYLLGNLYGVILGVLSIFLCIRYYYRADEKSYKEQTKLVTLGFAIPFIVYLATNVITPYFNVNIPPLGNISSMFMSIFVGYGMRKYHLFILNPALAAENIIEIMPDSFILTDPHGIILRVNQSLLELTSYTSEKLNGKSVTSLFSDELQGRFALETLRKDKKIKDFETTFKTKTGENKIVEFSSSVVRGKQDQTLGFACVVHNINQQKQMQEKLIKTERLASVGEAAIVVGHDLGNPLQDIRNATYITRGVIQQAQDASSIPDMPKVKKMLDIIDDSVTYANNSVLDLKDYATDKKPLRRQADINVLVDASLRELKIPEGITIKRIFKQMPLLEVDVDQLKRVFQNIVNNGLDAMDQNGTLTITTREIDGFVEVTFKDTGRGIPDETRAKLFKPFYTTKIKGMGLGLAICQKFVQAHNGTIIVESEKGKGSTFIVKLPAIVKRN